MCKTPLGSIFKLTFYAQPISGLYNVQLSYFLFFSSCFLLHASSSFSTIFAPDEVKMKKTLLLYLALYSYISVFSQLDARFWNPSSSFMEDVAIADTNTILITGSNYYATTLNGGQSWNGLSSGGMFVKAACFPSTHFGIAVGNDGYYRINTDCAYFWGWGNNKYIGSSRDLRDVSFIDDFNGMICGELGKLMRTSNQASSFIDIPSGTFEWLNGVFMINDSLAFVCGDLGTILKIVNDTLFSSQTVNASINLKKLFFLDENTGFAVGTSGTMYKTIDQGVNWSLIPLSTTEDVLNIDFRSESDGAICGTNGLIMITEDGGSNWTQSSVLQSDEIRSIAYVNDQYLIAVAAQFILHSYDGGLSWMRTNGQYRAIDFPSDSVGFATAYNGVAQRTKDGGNTWELMNLNTLQYLNDINFLNPDTGYAVGGSEVFRTLDGGDTWTSLPNPATTSLYSIDFWDYDHGIAVGYNYSIMTTSNGGTSWTYNYSWGVSQWYLDVQFTSATTAYMCSSTGAVLKSTNAGASWTNTFTGNSNQLARIFFLDDELGFACGLNGTIIKTINGGDDWELLDSGTDALYLNGIHFVNADTGFVAGSDGTYLRTYDGGDTWINSISGYLDFSDLTMSPNGTIWATANGVIFGIAPFNSSSISYALCAGSDKIYFNCLKPYHDNDIESIVNVELTTREDIDFSNAVILQSLLVDSVGLVNATIPAGLSEGIYKYRIIDTGDPDKKSLERYFKVIEPPQISVSLQDSVLIATSDQQVTFVWYFRASGEEFGSYIGNTDSVSIPGPGEFWLQTNSNCCSTTIDWTTIGECNGQLILEDEFIFETEYQICNGDSLEVAGNYYHLEGIYSDTLSNAFGCDSILISQLSFFEVDSTYLVESICSNESYLVGTSIYTTSGSYIDTLLTNNGCDSIILLDLTVFEISILQFDTAICEGDTLWIGTSAFFESGSYSESLINQYGCDSILDFELTVFPQGEYFQSVAICEGESYSYGENTYSESGSYIDSLINPIGCLEIMNTELIVYENPVVYLGNDTTICEDDVLLLDAGAGFTSYLWNTNDISQSINVNEEGIYSVLVSDDNECFGGDSITIYVEVCTSINERMEAYGIRIFPNPNNGLFTIESATEVGVRIYNLNGMLVYENDEISSASQIQLADSGVYLIHFIFETDTILIYSLIVNN